jgi:hypothetical protein
MDLVSPLRFISGETLKNLSFATTDVQVYGNLSNSTSSTSIDFPSSNIALLVSIILLNASSVIGMALSMWNIWKIFKKWSFFSGSLLASLFFGLITQIMVIVYYSPVSLDIKDELTFYRQPAYYASTIFSWSSVLIRFYSLIPSMTQLCCIGNPKVYKILTYLMGGLVFILWGSTLSIAVSRSLPRTLTNTLIAVYATSFVFVEMIVASVLLYLVLGTKRPLLRHLSRKEYLIMNYKPILVHILTYLVVVAVGVTNSSSNLQPGAISYSFLRLLGTVFEGWYYICQVWFLILIRDTSQNLEKETQFSKKSQNKSTVGNLSGTQIKK